MKHLKLISNLDKVDKYLIKAEQTLAASNAKELNNAVFLHMQKIAPFFPALEKTTNHSDHFSAKYENKYVSGYCDIQGMDGILEGDIAIGLILTVSLWGKYFDYYKDVRIPDKDLKSKNPAGAIAARLVSASMPFIKNIQKFLNEREEEINEREEEIKELAKSFRMDK